MVPPKRAPGKLGTVARNRNRFRVQVRLNGITGTGPLRTTEADARADLVLVRACQTREEIPALLARLRRDAGMVPTVVPPRKLGTVVANKRRFRAQVKLDGIVVAGPCRTRAADAGVDLAMLRACRTRAGMRGFPTRQKRANNGRFEPGVSGKLGIVAPNKHRFRAQVWLNGRVEAGPLRPREVDANADLAMVRACPAREQIPALLGRLREHAAKVPRRLPLTRFPCSKKKGHRRCSHTRRSPRYHFRKPSENCRKSWNPPTAVSKPTQQQI